MYKLWDETVQQYNMEIEQQVQRMWAYRCDWRWHSKLKNVPQIHTGSEQMRRDISQIIQLIWSQSVQLMSLHCRSRTFESGNAIPGIQWNKTPLTEIDSVVHYKLRKTMLCATSSKFIFRIPFGLVYKTVRIKCQFIPDIFPNESIRCTTGRVLSHSWDDLFTNTISIYDQPDEVLKTVDWF